MKPCSSRRQFLRHATLATAGIPSVASLLASAQSQSTAPPPLSVVMEKPALLGGSPVRTTPFPGWPVFDDREGQALGGGSCAAAGGDAAADRKSRSSNRNSPP